MSKREGAQPDHNPTQQKETSILVHVNASIPIKVANRPPVAPLLPLPLPVALAPSVPASIPIGFPLLVPLPLPLPLPVALAPTLALHTKVKMVQCTI
jgi:hypothetical protein